MRIPTRPLAFLLALLLGVSLYEASAEAKCAGPGANWSLADGQDIPSQATLYYFAPTIWGQTEATPAPRVLADGEKLSSEWKEASKNEAFTTYRLSFDAGPASLVVIEHEGESRQHGVTDWKRPVERSLVGSVGPRLQDAWVCSHTDVLPVEVKSRAKAFRVHWLDVRSGVIDFGHGSSIFPASNEAFWRGGRAKSSKARFELGHPNCFDYNVPAKNLDFLMVSVTPLYRDGSEGKSIRLQPIKTVPEPKQEPVVPAELPLPTKPETLVPLLDTVTPPLALEKGRVRASFFKARTIAIALLVGALFGLLAFAGRQHLDLRRLLIAGSALSLGGAALALGASAVTYPLWLLFLAAALVVVLLAARFARKGD